MQTEHCVHDKQTLKGKGEQRAIKSLWTWISGAIEVEAGRGRSLGPGVGIEKSLDPEAETGRSQDLEAEIENEGLEHVPDRDPDTGIGLEAGADQGVEVGKCSFSRIK